MLSCHNCHPVKRGARTAGTKFCKTRMITSITVNAVKYLRANWNTRLPLRTQQRSACSTGYTFAPSISTYPPQIHTQQQCSIKWCSDPKHWSVLLLPPAK